MADFLCEDCKHTLSVTYASHVNAAQGLARCRDCRSWTPFRIETGVFAPVEMVMPARVCPRCGVKAAFRRRWEWPPNSAWVSSLDTCVSCEEVVYFEGNRTGEAVDDQYPKNTQVPEEELPESIKKAFAEALVCHASGAPNGALLMCRRAIQEALDGLGAKKGNLPAQFDDLVSKHKITPDLKDWADHARIGGKLAGHGTGGKEWGDPAKIWGDTEDSDAVIKFCTAFFEYVYVLPERNKQRRINTGTPLASESDAASE